MDTRHPCYVSMAHLLDGGRLDGRRDGGSARKKKRESELMSLDDIRYSLLEREAFLALMALAEMPAGVLEFMDALADLARNGRLRQVDGVMIDMRIRTAAAGRKKVVQVIKVLLSLQVEVILVDGHGYCVNLLDLDQFCTSHEFVDIYMDGIFADHRSFAVMPKSSPSMEWGLGQLAA